MKLSDKIRATLAAQSSHEFTYMARDLLAENGAEILAAIEGVENNLHLEQAIDRMGWPEIDAFFVELRKGQGVYEDGGGYFIRAIKRLFGLKPVDDVLTYKEAAKKLLHVYKEQSN